MLSIQKRVGTIVVLMFFGLEPSAGLFAHWPHKDRLSCQSGMYPQGPRSYAKDSRLNHYDVRFYHIDLSVNDTSTFLQGSTRLIIEIRQPGIQELVFELAEQYRVDSVMLDGQKKGSVVLENDLLIFSGFQDTLKEGESYEITVYYQGSKPGSGFFSGIINAGVSEWDKRVTYTLSEPFSAKDWYVVKQVLNDKADSAWVFLTVDSALMAGSVGLLDSVTELEDGKKRFEWKTRYPIAFYLLSLAVSDYRDYSFYVDIAGMDSILVQNYIYNHPLYLTENKERIDKTADLLVLFSELFGTYPFHEEKYGHALAPIGGGMEHQTMTTLDDFRFNLVAHELGHQWFGNYVTCGTWQDIWINEGFASYSEYLALQYLKDQPSADDWMENAHLVALQEDQGSVYVPFEESTSVSRIFSGRLSYKKGAALLHMIRYELDNDSLFFGTLKSFLEEFGNSTATGEDFKNVLEAYTGNSFDSFFNQWYYGAGYPVFYFTWKQVGDSLRIEGEQRGSAADNLIFDLPYGFRLIDASGGQQNYRTRIKDRYFSFMVPLGLNDKLIQVLADPDNWILDKHYISSQPEDTSGLRIRPNPFTDSLVLEFNASSPGRQVYLTDVSGRLIRGYEVPGTGLEINIPFLPGGIYLIRVEEDAKSYTRKVVKQ